MNLTNGIITKGLGVGLPASSTLISMHFYVFALSVTTTPVLIPGGGGGSNPLAPGQFKNFYQPVDPSAFTSDIDPSLINHPIFVNDSKNIKELIAIKITFNGNVVEKEFAVPIRRARVIVNIVNFINTTKEKLKVNISSIKQQKNKLMAKIYKLRKHK